MVAAAILITQALLASAALAAPQVGGLAGRFARRRENSRLSRPLQLSSSNTKELVAETNTTHAEESTNWSGAVLIADSAVCFHLLLHLDNMS